MIRRPLSLSKPAKPLAALKPPEPKPVAPKPAATSNNTVARLATQSGFKPAPAASALRKPTLAVQQPQVTVAQGGPSFRVPQGIVPEGRSLTGLASTRLGSLPNGIIPERAGQLADGRKPAGIVPEGSELTLRGPGALSGQLTRSVDGAADRLRLTGALQSLDTRLGKPDAGGLLSGDMTAMTALKMKMALGGLGELGSTGGLGRTDGPLTSNAVSDDARVQQAAEEVQDAYEEHGAEAAAQVLEDKAAELGSPELVDALIEETEDTVEAISEDLAEHAASGTSTGTGWDETEAIITSLSAVADLASDAGVEKIAQPIAQALDAVAQDGSGPLTHPGLINALEVLGAEGKGLRLGAVLANELNAVEQPALAHLVGDTAIHAVDEARGNLADARAAREEKDAALQAQLAELEGVLTPEQRQQYINDYRELHADVYAAETEAAAALDQTLAASTQALEELVADGVLPPGELVAAYEDLANSPLPARAVEFAARVMEEGLPTAEAFGEEAERIGALAEAGMAGALTQYQSEMGGDPAQALEKYDALVKSFEKVSGLPNVSEAVQSGEEILSALRKAQTGDFSELQAIVTDSGTLDGLKPFASSVAAAALGFSIVNLQNQEGFADFSRALADVGKSGAELLVQAIGSLEKSGRLAALAGSSAAGIAHNAEFLQTKVLPGLGALLGVAETADAVGDLLRDDATGREILNVVTSAISTVGAFLTIFPATAPLGVVLSAVGALANFIGGAIFDAGEREEQNQEQYELLRGVLVDSYGDSHEVVEGARQMAFSSDNNTAVLEEAGLSPRQIVELMGTVPLANDRNFLEYIVRPLAEGGYQGREFIEAVQSLSESDQLEGLLANIGGVVASQYNATDEQLEALNRAIYESWIEPALEEA